MDNTPNTKYGLGYTLITGFTGFISRTILPFRKTEITYIIELLKDRSYNHILDFGCNTGYLLKLLCHAAPKNTYYGADINPHALNTAKRRNPDFTFFLTSQLSQHAEYFDVIIISHVLEHVHDGKKMLDQAHRLLKKNGTLIIAIPQERIRGDATIFQLLYNVMRLRFENPHVISYNYENLKNLLNLSGYDLVKHTYTHYFFPFKSQKRRFDSWSLVTVCQKKS